MIHLRRQFGQRTQGVLVPLAVELAFFHQHVVNFEGQYMGLLRFEPAGWRAVRALLAGMPAAEVDRLDMTSLLRRLIEAGTAVKGVAAAGRLVEVDSGEDLELYERLIDRGELTLVEGTGPRA